VLLNVVHYNVTLVSHENPIRQFQALFLNGSFINNYHDCAFANAKRRKESGDRKTKAAIAAFLLPYLLRSN
jgi:hypothetical protein